MPQITVYLRNDDLPKWKSIPNKAEFLHNAINKNPTGGLMVNSSVPITPKPKIAKSSVPDKTEKLNELVNSVPGLTFGASLPKSQLKSDNGICKIHQINLNDRGKCMQKGCKYGG